jgi:hypothetical protein
MITLITPNEPKFLENAILRAVEDSAPIDAWTIDELNQCADLDSVRDAWSHTEPLAA